MSRSVALVTTDLGSLTLVRGESVSLWSSGREGERGPQTPASARRSAEQLADWLASRREVRRRLGSLVLELDEAVCVWVRPPSTAGPVLAASVRSLGQEWGEWLEWASAEPLLDDDHGGRPSSRWRIGGRGASGRGGEGGPEPGAGAEGSEGTDEPGRGVATVALFDAAVRLLMDAADRRGVRVDEAMTLWHAVARAWPAAVSEGGAADDAEAVVLADGGRRLVWVWRSGSGLLAGGVVWLRHGPGSSEGRPDEDGASSAVRRLGLDWLTWSGQLGLTPGSLVVAGEDAERWRSLICSRWSFGSSEAREEANPLGVTLSLLSGGPSGGSGETNGRSGRRVLLRLSGRPTRSVRRRYTLSGLAMLLFAVAVGSIAFRLIDKAGAWSSERGAISSSTRSSVLETWPDLRGKPMSSPARAAEGKLREARSEQRFQPPPAPKPVFEESLRVAGILAALDEDLEARHEAESGEEEATARPGSVARRHVKLTRLKMDDALGGEFAVIVQEREDGTAIFQALRREDEAMSWEMPRTSNPQAPQYRGAWR